MQWALADEFCGAVWRDLLPPGVCFSAGFEPHVDDLTPPEQARLGAAGERRRREFAAGRSHARRALRELGLRDASIPRGDDGAPVWPEGFTGALSHTMAGDRLFAVAAVARLRDAPAIGIDVEAPSRPHARVWETVLTQTELAQVVALPVPLRAAEVAAYWCAKEAVIKAWRGHLRIESIGIFREFGSSAFEARTLGIAHGADAAPVCTGKIAQHAGWTFAAALCGERVPSAAVLLASAIG